MTWSMCKVEVVESWYSHDQYHSPFSSLSPRTCIFSFESCSLHSRNGIDVVTISVLPYFSSSCLILFILRSWRYKAFMNRTSGSETCFLLLHVLSVDELFQPMWTHVGDALHEELIILPLNLCIVFLSLHLLLLFITLYLTLFIFDSFDSLALFFSSFAIFDSSAHFLLFKFFSFSFFHSCSQWLRLPIYLPWSLCFHIFFTSIMLTSLSFSLVIYN